MSLPVNPSKVMRLLAPLWLLLALSLWIEWSAWQSKPLLLTLIALAPVIAGLAASLMRGRWRLELTPTCLLHHGLARTERFDWARMGQVELKSARVSELLLVRTFWFAFPLDAPVTPTERLSRVLGRRFLCVFGDHSAQQTIRQIEDWRAQYARPQSGRGA